MLKKSIQEHLGTAMKNKKVRAVSILRLINAEIKNKEIDLQRELTDPEIIAVIRKQIKKLQDALELFKKGNRADLVSENEEQINILMNYLPTEMSDDDLKKIIEKIIKDNQNLYEKNKKSIIGLCMKQLSSSVSPNRIINTLKEYL